MSAPYTIAAIVALWVVGALLVALVVGRAIKRADREPDAPEPTIEMELAVTPTEAGEMLGGLSDPSVRKLIAAGHLTKLPGTARCLIPVVSIERYVASCVTDSDPTPPHGIPRISIGGTVGRRAS